MITTNIRADVFAYSSALYGRNAHKASLVIKVTNLAEFFARNSIPIE